MPLSAGLGNAGLRPGVCTSTSRPASPYDGQTIYETDSNLVRIWNGLSWKTIGFTDYTSGSVIQVVSEVKTDTYATTPGAQWADIPGLSATITPTSTTSKVLVLVDVKGSGSAGVSVVRTRLLRNNGAIYTGNAASNRPLGLGQFYIGADTAQNIFYLAQLGGNFLDSPSSTSALTYKVQIGSDSNVQTVFINRTQGDRDTAYYDSRIASSITLMEIAA